jgi:ribonuclease HII
MSVLACAETSFETALMPQKPTTVPDFRRERRLGKKDQWPVAGIDEVGRGCLAGPVAAAAVILDPAHVPRGINDSKCLTAALREELYEEILTRALSVSVCFVTAAEIDKINIRQASLAAMRGALAALAVVPRYVLIDGNDLPQDLACPGEAIIKGDGLSVSIAAASIIAKVARDRLMTRLCQAHPAYGFSRHVGYATQEHLEALAKHGPSPYHRLSFSPLRAL